MKWEYKIITAANFHLCEKELINAGESNWELASVTERQGVYKLFLKRPKVETKELLNG